MSTLFANEQLSALLDGELTEAEVAALEAELENDPALAAELEALRQASSFVRDHAPVSAPEGFTDRLAERLAAEPMPAANNNAGWRSVSRMVPGLAVAATALLVIGVAVWTPGRGLPDAAAPGAKQTTVDPALSPVAAAPAAQGPAPAPPPSGYAQAPSAAEGGVVQRDLNSAWQQAEPVAQERAATSWRYSLMISDEADFTRLSELARAEGGVLEDAAGAAPQGLGPSGEGTWYVRLPAERLAGFGARLGELGRVQAIPDPDWYGSDLVKVRVDVRLVGGNKLANEPAVRKQAPAAAKPVSTTSDVKK